MSDRFRPDAALLPLMPPALHRQLHAAGADVPPPPPLTTRELSALAEDPDAQAAFAPRSRFG